MNYFQMLANARNKLKQAGKEEGSALHLLLFFKQWDKRDYLLWGQEQVSEKERREYEDLIQRRLNSVPLQEILGSQNFFGYEIRVNRSVLTPRPETEQLVELVLRELERKKNPAVLDLCTGSGCIAVAIAGERPDAFVTGADISAEVLEIAKENGDKNRVRIDWKRSDLFTDLTGCFDGIVSNPPYIPAQEVPTLDREVRDYDPILALDGGKDGLDFYRRIAEQAQAFLKPKGMLFLEIGDGQAESVQNILIEAGWSDVKWYRDYAGRERMITATLNIDRGEKNV